MSVDDRAVTLLDQYDVTVLRTWKGRGAILCDTTQGLKIFKEYAGTKEKIEMQDKILRRIREEGFTQGEQIHLTKEGEYLTKDYNQITYVLKDYSEGRECNVKEPSQCVQGMKTLAAYHTVSMKIGNLLEHPPEDMLKRELIKHNKELKKIYTYLRKKSQKTDFEVFFLHHYPTFYNKALEVEEYVVPADWELPYCYCHGDYQYHNVLFGEFSTYLINFEKVHYDSRIKDISLYMRKVLEKQGWSLSLGMELLEAYEKVSPLSDQEYKQLYYRFAYPEKFWKIANYYYNSGKAFVSIRNMEKMKKLLQNQKDASEFMLALGKKIE